MTPNINHPPTPFLAFQFSIRLIKNIAIIEKVDEEPSNNKCQSNNISN